MTVLLWIAILSALGISTAATFLLISTKGYLRILDHPNERSLHALPTPRTGGLAIWLGIIIGLLIIISSFGLHDETAGIIGAALLIGVVSFIDDRIQVSIFIRLIAHLSAGGLLLFVSGIANQSWWPEGEVGSSSLAWALSLLYVVWMVNLYNFMDGMDGFAGGMATIGFGTLGLLGYLGGDDYYAAICWVIAAAAGGFLVWNFPPARIFMGDTGSSTLGLLAAALSLWADRVGLFPLWLALLIFSPFIIDATVTLIRRTLQGQRIWEAHRSHYYQRLVQAGWSHRRTVLCEYILMLLCSLSACAAYRALPTLQWVVLGGVASIYLLTIIGVYTVEKQYMIHQASKISPKS